MTRPSIAFLLTALALGVVACKDESITLSQGTNSSLSVRVYVDADGDGAFDGAIDVAVSGVTVTASGAGDLTQTTDANGVAAFDLAPGSYTLSVTGDVPAGAVLSTATDLVVVAQFQGGTITAEFRYSFTPGVLAGIVFRDDDMNGTYDVGTDTPAGGLTLSLVSGTDTVGTTATATDGTFTFTTLRPGDYSLEITPFPTITVVGGTSLAVTIGSAAQTDLTIEFTGNLVVGVGNVTIADTGATVAVEGVVGWQKISPPSVGFPFSTRLDATIQDGSGGIWLFDFGVDPSPVVIGDSVRVVGDVAVFRGKLQLTNISTIDVLANVGEPSAGLVTAADINAGSFQGQLVTIDGTVDSVRILSFGNQEVHLTDGAGDLFTVFADTRTDVLDSIWTVGELHAVTGVLGADDRLLPSGDFTFAHRLEVRGQDDIVLGGSSIDIADARGMDGQVVTVEGVLTWQQEFQTRLEAYIQDGTAGMALFDFGVDPTGLTRGDRIRIRGTVGSFRSEVQIGSVDVLSVVGNEPLPAARTVTAAEINAPMFEAELVTINGTVDSVNVLSFGNQDVFLTDGAGDTFLVFVDSRTGITDATWTVGVSYDVTGVLTFDDRNATLPARVEPRDPGDVQ